MRCGCDSFVLLLAPVCPFFVCRVSHPRQKTSDPNQFRVYACMPLRRELTYLLPVGTYKLVLHDEIVDSIAPDVMKADVV